MINDLDLADAFLSGDCLMCSPLSRSKCKHSGIEILSFPLGEEIVLL